MAWTPADSTAYSSLIAWYDADDSGTIAHTSGAVDQWDDKKNANDLTQTGAERPSTGTVTIGGLNAIDFGGSHSIFNTSVTDIGNGQPAFAIMGVYKLRTGYSSDGYVYAYGNGGAGDAIQASQQSATPSDELTGRHNNGYAESDFAWSNGDEIVCLHQLPANQNYSSTEFFIDGTSTGVTATTTSLSTSGTKEIVLGDNITKGALYGNCAIGEILFFDATLSQTEREEIEGYLAHKWGLEGNLPDGHPYKSAPPSTGQTITGSDHVDSDSFGSGSVSVGPVAITGTLFTDGDTFGAGTVAPGAVTVTGALYADPDSFFAGEISTGAVTIAGGAHADPDAFGSGAVSQGGAPSQGITGSDHVDPDGFGSGAVSAGAVVIAGTLHVDGDSFGSGSVQPGSVTLTGTIFVDPDVIGSGIVSQGGPPPQNLGGLSFSDADVFGAGTIQPGAVSIDGGQFVDVDTFGAGLISAGGIQITGLRFSDPDSFGGGVIQPGQVVLAGTLFVDPDTFGAGTVSGGLLGKAIAIHLNGKTTSTLAGSRITSTLVDSRTP